MKNRWKAVQDFRTKIKQTMDSKCRGVKVKNSLEKLLIIKNSIKNIFSLSILILILYLEVMSEELFIRNYYLSSTKLESFPKLDLKNYFWTLLDL